MSARTIIVRQLGLAPYQRVSDAMHQFTENRDKETADELWLVEHPRVFTQGQAGKAEHLLAPGEIPVIQSDRGGQVTYHGPGQQVMYVMLDLKRNKLGVRDLVTALETTVVKTLAHYQIEAYPRPDAPRRVYQW
ncbi:Octanoyltransferase [Providencia stuartii]|nr:Octanoyltransferase [Providencia stuartii]